MSFNDTQLERFRTKCKCDFLQDIVLYTDEELAKRSNYSITECQQILNQVSRTIIHPIQSNQLKTDVLSIGDDTLNEFFNGGLMVGQVTEIYGESGTGKSSFAMQMSLQCQLPEELGGLDGGALYVSTSGRFSIRRLEQLVKSFANLYAIEGDASFMDQIYIIHIRDLETQNHILAYQVPVFVQKYHIRLLVIDSITPNFRGLEEGGSLDIKARSHHIYQTGQLLKQLASQFNMVVLCINEVSANFSNLINIGASQFGGTLYSQDQIDLHESTIPALGLSFSNCIHNRIRFDKIIIGDRSKRTMRMVFSPYCPPSTVLFEVTENGFKGIT
ncbi:P-loop containing nucleoside triphosphate hydrolase protein [Globomyces pollinis-pini]|nr:P-loop containing nucleoside triphosphate hydrolase protein [Globomyces pollinis-pini]